LGRNVELIANRTIRVGSAPALIPSSKSPLRALGAGTLRVSFWPDPLKERGELIGANDLWIAAAALRHGEALVTRNARDFHRVPGLQVLTY
jgi:hypothetical protein